MERDILLSDLCTQQLKHALSSATGMPGRSRFSAGVGSVRLATRTWRVSQQRALRRHLSDWRCLRHHNALPRTRSAYDNAHLASWWRVACWRSSGCKAHAAARHLLRASGASRRPTAISCRFFQRTRLNREFTV
jgi:hypothetical protein